MVLFRTNRVYNDYNISGVTSHTDTIEILETVPGNDMYYIKRVLQWKVDVGVKEEDLLPKRLCLKSINDDVRKIASTIVFNKECKENYNATLIKEEVTIEYTPSVDMFFNAAENVYINLDRVK